MGDLWVIDGSGTAWQGATRRSIAVRRHAALGSKKQHRLVLQRIGR
jgi:hypothetical protein